MRLSVWKWDGLSESLCPDCRGELVAKRGEVVRGHWAHKHASGGHGCSSEESAWHMSWKLAYLEFQDWDIEVPVCAANKTYRIDALNRKTGEMREFVHSLSDSYFAKHQTLSMYDFDLIWIFDGDQFVRDGCVECRSRDGMRRFLKPKAFDLVCFFEKYNKNCAFVHWGGLLYKHWKNNVWFPVINQSAKNTINKFEVIYYE